MKRTIAYILSAAAVLLTTACNGFLDKGPRTSQSTELTLSKYSGLNSSTLGAYTYLGSAGWYGGNRVLESEMRSGNGIKAISHNSNRYATEMNWNYTADATNGLWAYGYITVSRVNNVLDNLEGKEGGEVSQQDIDNLRAECLFLRALSHFDMVTLYAQPYSYATGSSLEDPSQALGIPYIFHTSPDDQSPRNTVKEVYDYIVADLLEAESLIADDYARAGVADAKAVVSKSAIQALLSRVYLYMGQWQNAADYATKVIGSGKYRMWTPANYASAWTANTGGDEVIFEVYIDMNNLSNTDCSYMTYPDGAYGDCIASPELYALYEDGDVRKDVYVQDAAGTEGLWWTAKYAGKGLNVPDANNTVILRLSEMYLNRAEAIVNGASVEGTSAVQDLNVITSNRGAAQYSSVGYNDIRVERRKELAWEGHYFFDLARWGQSLSRGSSAFLTESNRNISFPSYRWALPIPKSEMEVNANLVQNYKY